MTERGPGHQPKSVLDDIEDLVATDAWEEIHRPPRSTEVVMPRVRKHVSLKRLRTSQQPIITTTTPEESVLVANHNHHYQQQHRETPNGPVPGTQKIWVKTFGCSHNVSDSEYMEGILASYGYTLLSDDEKDEADLWLLNSCTVKDPSQAAFVHLIKKAQEENRPVVVAGCVPQGDRQLADIQGISVVGVQQIDRVVEVVEKTLEGNTVRLLGKGDLPRLNLPKVRRNPLVEIIPLSTGCLGSCTYCKTRHARGKLGSYMPEAIFDRAREVLKDGVTEIWLSSEDTGAYGRDIGSSISYLLEGFLTILPEDVMLRVGMTNPPFILEQMEEVAEVLCHPNVFAFLHVPVQSGSNRVLANMRREYTVEQFTRLADFLLERVPGICLATDIICGFPGETEEDFEETLRLVRRYRPAILNISQFYPRPGTPAAKMRRVPTSVVKDRSRRLTRLFESFEPYRGMEGQIYKVWVNTEVSNDGNHIVGHTKSYVKVLLPYDKELIGCVAQARVLSVARFHVVAEVLGFEKIRRDLCRGASAGGGQVLLNLSHRRRRRLLINSHATTIDDQTSSSSSSSHTGGSSSSTTGAGGEEVTAAAAAATAATASSTITTTTTSSSRSAPGRHHHRHGSSRGSSHHNSSDAPAPPGLGRSGSSFSGRPSSARAISPLVHEAPAALGGACLRPGPAINTKSYEAAPLLKSGGAIASSSSSCQPVIASCAGCVMAKTCGPNSSTTGATACCTCASCQQSQSDAPSGSGSFGSFSVWSTGSFRWDTSRSINGGGRRTGSSSNGKGGEGLLTSTELGSLSFWILIGILCCICSWLVKCASVML